MPSTTSPITLDARREEVAGKLAALRRLIADEDLSGVVLTRQFLVGWVTAGLEDRIVRGDETGFLWVLVTPDRACILTSNIEAPRLLAEESPRELGFEVLARPWYEGSFAELVGDVCDPARVGHDGNGPGRDVAHELQELRLELTAGERERIRVLGRFTCAAVESALRELRPGTTEAALCGEVSARMEERGVFPFAVLVGADDRRRAFRHPTVSLAPIERDVLVVVVGVRGGLNVALSRTASFGRPDATTLERHRIACEAEGAAIAACRPGATYGEALQALIDVYEANGYADEWRHHTQGGTIGYGGREFVPSPRTAPNPFTDVQVAAHHAVAWNPTCQGGKSEDTFLVTDDGPELISNSAAWPSLAVDRGPARPAILEL